MKTKKLSQKKQTTFLVFVLLAIMVATSFLTIQASGYNPDPIEPPPGGTHTFKCYGYVTSGGAPLSGALVRLTYGDPETGIYVSDYTDSNGYYYIAVTTSYYVNALLRASKSGYNSASTTVYTSGVVRKDFSLSLAAHYFRVYGYVKSEIGTPIQGVTTKLKYGSTTYKTDVTHSNGYYSMAITTTLYQYFTVTAEKTGYNTGSKSVYSSSTRRADFTLYASDGDKFYDIVPKFTKVSSLTGGPVTNSEPINLIWRDTTAASVKSFFTANGWSAKDSGSWWWDVETVLFIPVAIRIKLDFTNTVGAYDGSAIVNNYQGEAYVKNSEYSTLLQIGIFKIQIPMKRDHFRLWEIEDSNGDTIVYGSGTYDDGIVDELMTDIVNFFNDPIISAILTGLSIVNPAYAVAQLATYIPSIASMMLGYSNAGHMISSTDPWRTASKAVNTWVSEDGSYYSLDRLSVSKTWTLTTRSLTWTGTAYELYN